MLAQLDMNGGIDALEPNGAAAHATLLLRMGKLAVAAVSIRA